MNDVFVTTAIALLALMGAGLIFVNTRASAADALLAVLLFGSLGVAITLVLGEAQALPRALDLAVTMALLAAILGVAAVLRGGLSKKGPES
jgi:hypothetical protein